MNDGIPVRALRAAIVVGALIALGARTSGARAELTITFDHLSGGNPALAELVVGDFRFTSPHFHSISDATGGFLSMVDNGTPFIGHEGGIEGRPITLTHVAGLPFSLVAFDSGEGFVDPVLAGAEGFANANAVRIDAVLSEGGNATGTFLLDGLYDGPAGLDDFETFALPATFADITSATFSGVGGAIDPAIALDNIVVVPPVVIPEPAAGMLAVVVGLLVFTVHRGRRNILLEKGA
jgi:hypothetical protein